MILSSQLLLAFQIGAVFSLVIREFDSLGGLSDDDIENFSRNFKIVGAQPVPGPIADTSIKLVNDIFHPWLPLVPGQQRGPCPGLNTLASHGWLPRSGVATPGEIVTAAQEGFNMGWDLATLVTYAAFLVDGNPLTNLMSIGGKTALTGSLPAPALVSGLSTHGTFEGDSSMTRGDAFFGDNHSFNETLFEQIVETSNKLGGGKYNVSAAAEVRFNRVQDSIARNPTFTFANPRFATAFAETIFPIAFFIDGRSDAQELDLKVMRGFFADSRMPVGFHRRNGSFETGNAGDLINIVSSAHTYIPGFNNGSVNNFVPDLSILGNQNSILCALIEKFVNTTIELYPNPQGALRKALNGNIDNIYLPVKDSCTRLNPFP